MGIARLSRPRHRVLRQERAQGPLCRHLAREFHPHDGDLLLLLHQVAKRAAALMPAGGSMVTLTYNGGQRAMPNYNVMGVAKAALEASVRYLAVDFGPSAIRVNAISAGPTRTLAGAGIADARQMFAFQQRHSPLRRGVTLDEIGGGWLCPLSGLSTGVTGDIHFVDSGYNIITMPQPAALKNGDEGQNGNGEHAAKDAAQ